MTNFAEKTFTPSQYRKLYDNPFLFECPRCDCSLEKTLAGLFSDRSNGFRESGSICCPECDTEIKATAYWDVAYIEIESEEAEKELKRQLLHEHDPSD